MKNLKQNYKNTMSNLPAQKVTQKTTIQKYRHTDLLEALFLFKMF